MTVTVQDQDRHHEAELAADELLATLERRIAGEDVDVDTAIRTAVDALSAVASADRAAAAEHAARKLVHRLDTVTARMGRPTAAAAAHGNLHTVRAELDRALTAFDVAALEDAEQQLAAVEQSYADEHRRLEKAVTTGDLETVTALRDEVTFVLPARIASARLRVLQLRIAQAEAETAAPRRRRTETADALTRATTELDEARRQLTAAEERLGAARLAAQAATAVDSQARAAVDRLRAEHDQLRAAHEEKQQAVLRRLAGLPDEPEPVTAGAARSEQR